VSFQVDTVFVWVNDLEQAVEWYQAVGFEVGDRFGPWQSLVVDGETRFALHQGIRDEGESTAVPSFRVADLDAEMERMARAGIHPSSPDITDTGVARFVRYTDPDGNEIQMIER
jgi:catechol 2,3-dioxygenase-like lactoylglutathione lyase family enzyme